MSNKGNNKLIKADKQRDQVAQEHKSIIDTWFNNGYNGAKAMIEHRPDITYNTAKVLFSTMIKTPANAQYIAEKRQEQRAKANIQADQITRELISWIYSDATDYIGLTVEEVKALPNELKRCIQSVKHRVKEYKDRNGNDVKEEVLEVRIIDKSKAVEILNKMLGHYSLDNSQKANTINVQNLNVNELKVLANILQKTDKQ